MRTRHSAPALAAAITLLLVPPAMAQPAPHAVAIDANTPLFCLDDDGAYKPVNLITYGKLVAGVTRLHAGWRSQLVVTGPSAPGKLIFSPDGRDAGPDRITFAVRPMANGQGIGVISMHSSTGGKPTEMGGGKMCAVAYVMGLSYAAPG